MKPNSDKIKILHLEDAETDAIQIAWILKKGNLDCHIMVVDSEEHYREALRDFCPDLILSDHSLPAFNSMEALAILKTTLLDVPFVLVTGAVSEEFAASAIKSGADDYLLKDRLKRLPSAVINSLEKYRLAKEQKEIAIRVKDSEKQYYDLIQSLPAAIYTCDSEGKILLYNKAAVELWGREPVVGKESWCGSWKMYNNHNEPIQLEACPMARAIREGKNVFGEEIIIAQPNGTKKYVVPHPSPNFDSNGNVIGATNVLIDITDRKLAEIETLTLVDKLQLKNKELGQFGYMISHNLRSPIARILGLTSIIDYHPEENKFILEKITEETTNLDNVVRDIGLIVSARSSQREKSEEVCFDNKLKLIKQVLGKEIAESEVIISADFKCPGAFTIKSYVYSILFNLLSNAIKYKSKERGLHIEIGSTSEGELVCITVKDNGSGIDLTKHRGNVFGLYKRFHGEEILGKGVGLYLAKTHAETIGGRIEIESIKDKGTEFKVYFLQKYESGE